MENVQGNELWFGAITALMGLVFALAGYRMLRVMAKVACALLCFSLGATLGNHYFPDQSMASLGIGVGAGIVGFLIGSAYYFVSVFLFGAGAGIATFFVVVSATGWEQNLAGMLVGAGIGGVISLLLQRPFIIVASSLLGGLKFTQGVAVLTGFAAKENFGGFGWAFLGLAVVLAIAGCVVQFKTTRNMPERDNDGQRNTKAQRA